MSNLKTSIYPKSNHEMFNKSRKWKWKLMGKIYSKAVFKLRKPSRLNVTVFAHDLFLLVCKGQLTIKLINSVRQFDPAESSMGNFYVLLINEISFEQQTLPE